MIPPPGSLPPTTTWRWDLHLLLAYARLIADRMHFAQAVYGDGEWHCILGHEGQSAIGMVYEPWLGELLRLTLLEPAGQWCVYWGNPEKTFRAECDAWIAEHRPRVHWVPRRVLSAANCNGFLGPFLAAARTRRVLAIGPEHFRDLPPDVLDPVDRLEVRGNRAYEQIDEIVSWVTARIEEDDLVLFSCGMAAAPAIHRLWSNPDIHSRVTLYDAGAVFDPYCGVWSRKQYKREDWRRDAMPLNLREVIP